MKMKKCSLGEPREVLYFLIPQAVQNFDYPHPPEREKSKAVAVSEQADMIIEFRSHFVSIAEKLKRNGSIFTLWTQSQSNFTDFGRVGYKK